MRFSKFCLTVLTFLVWFHVTLPIYAPPLADCSCCGIPFVVSVVFILQLNSALFVRKEKTRPHTHMNTHTPTSSSFKTEFTFLCCQKRYGVHLCVCLQLLIRSQDFCQSHKNGPSPLPLPIPGPDFTLSLLPLSESKWP